MVDLQLGVWEGIDYICEVFRREFCFCKRNNKIVGDGAGLLVRKKYNNCETRGAICMGM